VSPYVLEASLRCFQLLVQSLDRHSRRIVQFMLAFFAHMLVSPARAGFVSSWTALFPTRVCSASDCAPSRSSS
jgi:hypothetical protein